jgi:nitroreductase
MDVTQALKSRYTCRGFKPTPVLKETLLEILDAAHRAPSWADTQPWEIYVATGEPLERLRRAHLDTFATGVAPHPDYPAPTQWPPALKHRMDELLDLHKKEAQTHPEHKNNPEAYLVRQMNFFKAPVVIYLCLDRSLGPWSIFDMGFFTQSLLLAAKEKGLDSAPAYRLVSYPDLVRQELGIPTELSILFGVALGYATEHSQTTRFESPRRLIKDVVKFKGF